MKKFLNKKSIYKICCVVMAILCIAIFCIPITKVNKTKLMAQNIANSSSYATTNSSAYYIKTASDLSKVGTGRNRYYLLNNITVSNHTPICKSSTSYFKGEFFGNGFTITIESFKTNTETYAGLFGYVDSTAKINNLNVDIKTNYSSSTTTHFGCLAGYVGSSVTIENCRNMGKKEISVSLSSSSSDTYVGGLIGRSQTNIVNCINNQNINASAKYMGGIVGSCNISMTGYTCGLKNCINYGKINAGNVSLKSNSSNGYIGGVAGYAKTIENCYNAGTITTSITSDYNPSFFQGGVVGSSQTVKECFNTGVVKASKDYSTLYIGGVSGGVSTLIEQSSNTGSVSLTTSADSKFYLGGVSGEVSEANSCLNTGSIQNSIPSDETFNYSTGGVFGRATATRYSNLYNNGDITLSALEDSYTNSEIIENVGTIIGALSKASVTFSSCVNAKESKLTFKDVRVAQGEIISTANTIGGLTKVKDNPWYQADVYAWPYEKRTGTLYYDISLKAIGNKTVSSGIEEYRESVKNEATFDFNVLRYEKHDDYNFYKDRMNRTLRFKIKEGKVYLTNKIDASNYIWSGDWLMLDSSTIGSDKKELMTLYDIFEYDKTTKKSNPFIYGSEDASGESFPNIVTNMNQVYNNALGAWFHYFGTQNFVGNSIYEFDYCSLSLQSYESQEGDKLIGYDDKGVLRDFNYTTVGPISFVYNKEDNSISFNLHFGWYSLIGSDDTTGMTPGGGQVFESSDFFSYQFGKIDLDAIETSNVTLINNVEAKSKISDFANKLGWVSYNGGYIKLDTF